MKIHTLSLNPNIDGLAGSNYVTTPFTFKGETKFVVDLNNFKNGEYDILQVQIDYGDGIGNINDKFSFTNLFSSSDVIYSHVYKPTIDENYYFKYYLTIDITFSNFKKFTNKFDIIVYKNSFYSLHNKLTINSAQFVDDSQNSVFAVIGNDNGDKFNFIIK